MLKLRGHRLTWLLNSRPPNFIQLGIQSCLNTHRFIHVHNCPYIYTHVHAVKTAVGQQIYTLSMDTHKHTHTQLITVFPCLFLFFTFTGIDDSCRKHKETRAFRQHRLDTVNILMLIMQHFYLTFVSIVNDLHADRQPQKLIYKEKQGEKWEFREFFYIFVHHHLVQMNIIPFNISMNSFPRFTECCKVHLCVLKFS